MDSFQAVHVLSELHITDASPRTSGTGVPQLISAATCNTAVINLEFAVLLTQLDEVLVKELSKPLLRTAINGVAISPCGSLVAAFTADAVYVAQLNKFGQLQKAAQVTGAKSVQWCPGSAALAIICQQADPLLLVLSTTQGSFKTAAATAAAELQHLTPPSGATFGARHAAWLPQQTTSGAAALLAAWPSDMLLYSWAPTQHGSPDWHHPQVHRILSGWPGPVRAITAVPADHKTSSCLVLGTVDAQLGLVSPAADPTATQQQQQQQTGVSKSTNKGSPAAYDLISPSDGGDDVLNSLMNIRSGPQQHRSTPVISAVDADHHHHDDSADDHSVRSLGSSAAASKDAWQLSSAALCVMHINLSDYNTQHNARSSSSSSIQLSTAAAAAAGGAISPSSSSFISVLCLEHHPLPNLLTVQQQFIAVGSTKGPPLVTLCSFDSQSGLGLMQTVSIPLPTATVGPDISKMRLEGLLLAAAPAEEDKQQQGGLGRPFDSNSSGNMFPAVPLSGGETASALLTTPVNVSPRQHKQQQQQRQGVSFYPDIVALVSCSSAEQPAGHFANLSSNSTARTAAAAAAQVYLLNCRAPQQQQQQQQRRRQISSLSSTSSGDRQHAAVRQTRHKQPAAASPRQPAADQPPLLRYLNDSSKRLKSPSTAAVVADDALKTGVYEQQQQRQQEQQQRSGVDLAVSPGASSLCPWMHSLDSKHSEQNAEQQQQPAANQQQQNHDAACNDAGSLQQQQQLQVIQQQLTCIVQQQALHTAASDERLNRLVDCLTRLENSMTNRSSNTQYLDATVDALSKMQITLHCMMQSMQQQTITTPMNGAEPASPAATRDSDATVTALHKMQATLENVLATLVQQQQQQHAQLCSSDSQAGSSTAAAFGSLQASIERLTDTIIQQQQRQQEAIQTAHKQQAAVVAAGLANLQVSLESRLDKLFQAQQQQQQQRPDDVVVSDALTRLQVSLEGKLDGVHQTLKEMVKVLAGLEEELAEVEQK